jgi:putative flippase GtrA
MRSYLKTFLTREAAGQFFKLALIGGVNTAIYFLLINIFRSMEIALLSRTTLAFALATLASYFLNRRWTFNIRQGWASIRETAKFFVINGAAWAVTAVVVVFADNSWGPLSRLEENLANVVAAGFILLPKFVTYRDVVFRSALRSDRRDPVTGSVSSEDGPQPDAERVSPHLP